MPPPFKQLQPTALAAFVESYPFRRQITEVHLHHTWRPNHSQYKGHQTIVAMYNHHTQTNGWSDLAQHATVAPNGEIWLGRNWNAAPASASGHNGSAGFGPFMIEMIGDFDKGRDVLQGSQLKSVLELIARIQLRFNLPPESLRFHNQMSGKTCPGSGIDRQWLIRELKAHMATVKKASLTAPQHRSPFAATTLQVFELMSEHSSRSTHTDPADAELKESDNPTLHDLSPSGNYNPAAGVRGGAELSAQTLADLRQYVISLTGGMLSSSGILTTDKGDVDAIFQQHLPAELQKRRAAGQKLHILFYAHGGLVSESNGLKIAAHHIPWWVQNGVYPIYFIWETGLFETIGGMLKKAISEVLPFSRGTRDLWDHTTDPIIEGAARAAHGHQIWGGMKQSAMAASSAAGGANYAAQQLGQFLQSSGDLKDIELHAVGHSAGSIFHSYFLPTALDAANGQPFQTLQFMAPAIRVDEFKLRLVEKLGAGINHLAMFTMKKDFERDDNCMAVYRKSLLYLIHHALEPEPKTAILGLEESVRNDDDLQKLFGLKGPPAANVIWSTTEETSGRSATRATTHGGFDDDAPTMESVLRRVLNLSDSDLLKLPFPVRRSVAASALRSWEGQVDWPEGLRMIGTGLAAPQPQTSTYKSTGGDATIIPISGNRRGLCVGINQYSGGVPALNGCVSDAMLWKATLESLGFQITLLTDEAATRHGILTSLQQLVESSRSGDVIVFQYAGHGTQLRDINGDEAMQDERDTLDEAFVPVDFGQSACIIDDDIAAITAQLPSGVNLTHFIDCCHSGTISRMMAGARTLRQGIPSRSRFVAATPLMEQLNENLRSQLPKNSRAISERAQRDILFSACTSHQTAKEHGTQGDFTKAATQVLAQYGMSISHADFLRLTTTSFNGWDDQTPELWCDDLLKHRSLLHPLLP